jgi:hypothetical protein
MTKLLLESLPEKARRDIEVQRGREVQRACVGEVRREEVQRGATR